jgi:hypothetical protein
MELQLNDDNLRLLNWFKSFIRTCNLNKYLSAFLGDEAARYCIFVPLCLTSYNLLLCDLNK